MTIHQSHSVVPLRDFALEVYFSAHEFTARHHLTASDAESLTMAELLAYATPEQRATYENLWLGYTPTWGSDDVRAAIAATYDTLEPQNILSLAGAGEGLYSVARVLLGPEDHVIVPTPNYQSAESVPLTMCAVTGVPLTPPSEANPTWTLDLDAMAAAIQPNTKMISVNFPHNPTGMVLPHEALGGLIALCRKHDLYLLSDEVYRGLELDPVLAMPQIADVYEKGLSLNVMSKAYGLPGLRVGWVASQDTDVLQKVERYKHYLSICNAAPAERLTVIALEARDKILARNRALVARNLALLEQVWTEAPGLVEWHRPQGGCVAFPRYSGPGTVERFCKDLLDQSGIMLLPSSIYASDLTPIPQDRFRIGFGRDAVFTEGLAALKAHLDRV